jgi:hypothetical protein
MARFKNGADSPLTIQVETRSLPVTDSDQPSGASKWRLNLNSATLCEKIGYGTRLWIVLKVACMFEPTQPSCRLRVNHCRQTRNSSPQMNAASCFVFESGRQDGVRTFLHRVGKMGCRDNASYLKETPGIEPSSGLTLRVKNLSGDCWDFSIRGKSDFSTGGKNRLPCVSDASNFPLSTGCMPLASILVDYEAGRRNAAFFRRRPR